jgi:hypothetical protein
MSVAARFAIFQLLVLGGRKTSTTPPAFPSEVGACRIFRGRSPSSFAGSSQSSFGGRSPSSFSGDLIPSTFGGHSPSTFTDGGCCND